MELSTLNRYPVSDPFVFDNGEVLELCWDANFFTRARMRKFDDELDRRVKEARAPHADKLSALQAEVETLSKSQEKRRNKTPKPEEEKRLTEIVAEVGTAADALEDATDLAAREVHAEALSKAVLMGWGMTHKGEAVPITKEVLEAQPLLFLQDLMAHARQRSLPKSRRQVTARLTTTPSHTNGTSSSPTTPSPEGPSTSPATT